MMTNVNPMRQRLLDYLLQFGLEGKNMMAYGWDDVGFEARNPITGKEDGFVPWPEGLDFPWFTSLALVADREDYRMEGIRA